MSTLLRALLTQLFALILDAFKDALKEQSAKSSEPRNT